MVVDATKNLHMDLAAFGSSSIDLATLLLDH
jgi:hypothetical protein